MGTEIFHTAMKQNYIKLKRSGINKINTRSQKKSNENYEKHTKKKQRFTYEFNEKMWVFKLGKKCSLKKTVHLSHELFWQLKLDKLPQNIICSKKKTSQKRRR